VYLQRKHDMTWTISPEFDYCCVTLLTLIASYVWGAVRKNIICDRFSAKTAISAHI